MVMLTDTPDEHKKSFVRFLLLAVLFMATGRAFAEGDQRIAGQVEFIDGDVKILSPQGVAHSIKLEESVYVGETIQCGAASELHVRLLDNGFIAIRPNTALKIDEYLAKGTSSDSAIFSLLKGTFRSITGLIGKTNPKNYKVQTPNATLGIRGTDHEPLFVPQTDIQDSQDASPGTYDKVNTGGTFIQNEVGRVEVSPDQVGFAPLGAVPRLVQKLPAFYRKTKNEGRIEERKEQLQGKLGEKVRDLSRTPVPIDGPPDSNDSGITREKVQQRAQEIMDGDNTKAPEVKRRPRRLRLPAPKP